MLDARIIFCLNFSGSKIRNFSTLDFEEIVSVIYNVLKNFSDQIFMKLYRIRFGLYEY